MARIRVSTTVSEQLINRARELRSDLNDAALLDVALSDLIARHRATEIDAGYSRYSDAPLDAEDEWGNLESFLDAPVGKP
jgi:post-segregation antitoxin (ccd killing protein)